MTWYSTVPSGLRSNMRSSGFLPAGSPGAIFRQIHDRQGEAIILKDLGTVYREMGRNDDAMKFHEQALAISREIKDRDGEGISLSNLGEIYRIQKDYQRCDHLSPAVSLDPPPSQGPASRGTGTGRDHGRLE